MGQSQISVIIKQDALNFTSKNSNERIVNDWTEINQCLSLISMFDQLSFQLSSISFNVSSITMNHLSYEQITSEFCQKEDLYSNPFQIMHKQKYIRDVDNQNLLQPIKSTQNKQGISNQLWNQERFTIDDFDIENKQESNSTKNLVQYQQDKNDIKIYQLKEDSTQFQRQINNQYKIKNGQQIIKNEKTENFSDEEVNQNNSFSISQNFAEFKQNQCEIDEKSYLQNNRFWSSDLSSTFIDFQINNQNVNYQYNNQSEKQLYEVGSNLKQFSQSNSQNQRIIYQQSFGVIKTVNQNQQQPLMIQHLITSPSVFTQNKQLKYPYNQINQQQIQPESNQNFGYTQLHTNKKMNLVNHQIHPINQIQQCNNNNDQFIISQQSKQQQIKKSNFHHSASPQTQIPQSQGQQKESMRQQFDRLLQDNKELKQKQKHFKEENTQNFKSPRLTQKKKDKNQNINKKQLQSPKDDKIPKKKKLISSQSPIENKGTIKNVIGYVEMNKIKKQYHRSPEQEYEQQKDQRYKIQDKQKDNNNLYSKYLNSNIYNLHLQSFHQKTFNNQPQKKQNFSNLQTAITQNISPSERGITNRPIIKDIINLNDISQQQEYYINFDQIATYRETQIQKLRKFSD